MDISWEAFMLKGDDEWKRCTDYMYDLANRDPLQQIAPYTIYYNKQGPSNYLTLTTIPTATNRNVHNTCHGGFLNCWADTAMFATALHVLKSFDCFCFTHDISYRFIKPIALGDKVIMSTSLDNISYPYCHVSCLVTVNGKLVGTSQARFYIAYNRKSRL